MTTLDTLCPACGFDLGFKAWNGDSASDEVCPSCGIQFGYDDFAEMDLVARAQIHQQWKKEWIAKGMRWSSVARDPPNSWDPIRQLGRLPESA
jgi:hypothetical protein